MQESLDCSKNPGFSFFVGKGDAYGFENDPCYCAWFCLFSGRDWAFCLSAAGESDRREESVWRENILSSGYCGFSKEAGYLPSDLLTISPEEMVEVPGITVPNIRAISDLCRGRWTRSRPCAGLLRLGLLRRSETMRPPLFPLGGNPALRRTLPRGVRGVHGQPRRA